MFIGGKHIEWNGAKQQEGVDTLSGEGGLIVSPTKVGYIIMTSDFDGPKRKFSAKQRALNKPGVVLCSSMHQLRMLAQMNDEVDASIRKPGTTTSYSAAFFPGRRAPQSTSRPTVRKN